MKFLIIGCYGLADGYKAMSNGLRYLGHDIAFFPLFASQNILKQNKNKSYSIEKEIIKACNGDNLTVNLGGYINNCSEICDSIIVWHGVDCCMNYSDMLKNIKEKTNIKLIQINWDPNPNFIKQLNSYYKSFDYIFSVNSKITKYLREKKYKNAFHFHQGFDEDYSFYKEDNKYKCDISILCTNLYTDPMWKNKSICRKKLLDILYEDKSINLHVYGPTSLKNKYHDAYKGYISYSRAYSVFSNSLVNLNISPVADSLTYKIDGKECYYFSERLPQILACKGLMVCDQKFGKLLIENSDYIRLEREEDIISIVNDVKNNKEKYGSIRNNGFNKVMYNMNCQKFGEEIMSKLE